MTRKVKAPSVPCAGNKHRERFRLSTLGFYSASIQRAKAPAGGEARVLRCLSAVPSPRAPCRDSLRQSPFVHLVAPPAFPGRRSRLWADFPARWQPPRPDASSLSLPADPSGIWVPPQDYWAQATPPRPAPEVLPSPQGSRMVRFSMLPLHTNFSVFCSTVESTIGG